MATEILSTKACTKCGEEKPFSEFWKHKKSKDGLRHACKPCLVASNRKNVAAYNKRHFSIEAIVRNPKGSAAVQERRKEGRRAWRINNPEKVRQHKHDSYERNKKKTKDRVQAWRKAHPDLHRAHTLRRRALQIQAPGSRYTTAEKIQDRVRFYGGRCFYCGAQYESIDHRIPLSRGGSHWPANLVPSCKSCNCRKNTKTEREFLGLVRG